MPDPTSKELCEALVRHTEVSGSEALEKHFINAQGKVGAVVVCLVGTDSARFLRMVERWFDKHGFHADDKT